MLTEAVTLLQIVSRVHKGMELRGAMEIAFGRWGGATKSFE